MERTRELTEDVVRTDEVIGVTVKNPQKEKLGEIEEIVLDKYSGSTRYAVLSFGGFLGIHDKFFALPWKSFHYDPNEKSFILNVDKEKLKNAPGFDKDHWPNFTDRQWATKIHDYYDVDPYWD